MGFLILKYPCYTGHFAATKPSRIGRKREEAGFESFSLLIFATYKIKEMTRIKDIIHSLEEWAPVALAESYDNVGLLVGDQNREITSVLISLDCTEKVVEEAIAKGCNMVISHHPLLFTGLKKLTGSNYVERTVELAIKNDIALYAIHTNLDNVTTGVNKMIADKIGLKNTRILSPKPGRLQKLEFFVPEANLKSVRAAIFNVGGGKIGNYEGCSFNTKGIGTFTPTEKANPTIGEVRKPHEEQEICVEVLIPDYLSRAVLSAMKEAHPYEEVAYFLHNLENVHQEIGSGMIGTLPEAMDARTFIEDLKTKMGLQVVKCTSLLTKKVKTIAVCGGSGSFLLNDAKRQKADVFITSDFKYHEFFDAEDALIIADIGHYESERFTIELIAEKLSKKFRTFATHLTEVNTNPIHYI